MVVTPPPDSGLRLIAAKSARYAGSAAGSNFGQAAYNGVLSKEFSMLTPENALKWQSVRPSRATFNYSTPDAMLAFATANGMKMRGHTLVWHSQNPAWLTSTTWPADTLTQILTDHITTVMGHYKGQVYAWDVVNEAFNDNGSLRATLWSTSLGNGYIEAAFRAARAADPAALLFYNDYSLEFPGAKQDAVFTLVNDFKTRGVPIDGIGFQAHFQINADLSGVPSRASLTSTFARFAALGLKVHITELDVRIRVPGATPAELTAQASAYGDVVAACRAVPLCEAIVVWGVSDAESWVPSVFPGYGNALLFDNAYGRKSTYAAVKASFESVMSEF
ncbi:MAG: endo-1,4-beta-xylanase [bacterium]